MVNFRSSALQYKLQCSFVALASSLVLFSFFVCFLFVLKMPVKKKTELFSILVRYSNLFSAFFFFWELAIHDAEQ